MAEPDLSISIYRDYLSRLAKFKPWKEHERLQAEVLRADLKIAASLTGIEPCCVYWLYTNATADVNHHGYVGVSEKWPLRLKRHRLSGDWPSDFEWKLLFQGTVEECLALEEKLRPTAYIGWNKAAGGEKGGRPSTLEQRMKQRKAALRRYLDPAESIKTSAAVRRGLIGIDRSGSNNSNFGKSQSEETKAKIRARIVERGGVAGDRNPLHGRPRSHKDKIAISAGVRANLKPRSEEERARRLVSAPRGSAHHAFGKPRPDATREKMRQAALAHDWSGERNGFYGKKHSEETRAKLRAAAIRRHKAPRA